MHHAGTAEDASAAAACLGEHRVSSPGLRSHHGSGIFEPDTPEQQTYDVAFLHATRVSSARNAGSSGLASSSSRASARDGGASGGFAAAATAAAATTDAFVSDADDAAEETRDVEMDEGEGAPGDGDDFVAASTMPTQTGAARLVVDARDGARAPPPDDDDAEDSDGDDDLDLDLDDAPHAPPSATNTDATTRHPAADASEAEEVEDDDENDSDDDAQFDADASRHRFPPSSASASDDGEEDEDEDGTSFLDLRHDRYATDGTSLTTFHETHGDTSAAQARAGRDVQGIPWDRLQFTREKYRAKRVAEYKNYANLDFDASALDGACARTRACAKRAPFFEFAHNTRAVRSNFVHFQLRNLVWATSKHDAYVMSENKIVHWNASRKRASVVLDLDGGASSAPNAATGATSTHGDFPRIQVSTTCVSKDGVVAAGGFAGELVVLDQRSGRSDAARITSDDNGITNAIEFVGARSGAEILVSSNNDMMTRFYDLSTMRCLGRHKYPWAVNYASTSADGRSTVVVGDSKEAWLVDVATGRRIATMEGHLDFSFAAAWHPNGILFATGNQDTTTKVWDARCLGRGSLLTLRGTMGAIRSLRFTSDGRFLAAAEPADFVHVYDVNAGFEVRQSLDHFGETAGIGFSPDGESLFVGVADLTYGSVLEYSRGRRGGGAVVV